MAFLGMEPATGSQQRWAPQGQGGPSGLGGWGGSGGLECRATSTPAVPGSALGRWATGTFHPEASDVGARVSHGTAGLPGRLWPDVGLPGLEGCFFFGVEGLDVGASLGTLVAHPWWGWGEGSWVSGVPAPRGVPAAAAR